MGEFSFTAGVFLRKNIRTMLESECFDGRDIRWMEDKRWLVSAFRVRGHSADVKAVESRVKAYCKLLDAV